MKKFLKFAALFSLSFCTILFAACSPTTPPDNFTVSAHVAKVEGLSVGVSQTTTKFEFDEIDNEAGKTEGRVNLFGHLGELDMISITVSGEISKVDADEHAVFVEAGGGYYTDYFELRIKLPSGATKYGVIHGLPEIDLTDMDDMLVNGYFVVHVQWLLLGADGWQFNGNTTTNDGFMAFAFADANDQIVQRYFIRTINQLTFVEQA